MEPTPYNAATLTREQQQAIQKLKRRGNPFPRLLDLAARMAKKENIPAFQVVLSVNKSMSGAAAYSKIAWNSVELNRGSCFDTTNFRFVAPVDGLYEFVVSIVQQTNVGGPIVWLYKNGSEYPSGVPATAQDAIAIAYGQYTVATGRKLVELDAEDYIETFLSNANGTSITVANYGTAFSGHLIEAY